MGRKAQNVISLCVFSFLFLHEKQSAARKYAFFERNSPLIDAKNHTRPEISPDGCSFAIFLLGKTTPSISSIQLLSYMLIATKKELAHGKSVLGSNCRSAIP
jgi:hypothetical protein